MASNLTWDVTSSSVRHDVSESDTCGVPDEGAHVKTVENYLWIFTAPIILIFSVCGNVMTVIIMTQKCMRGTSTCVYLSVIAVADLTVVVVGIIPEWLHQMGIMDLWEVHPVICQIELYLYYTFLDFAIWVLVAFTLDRVVAVCLPFHKKRYCTQRRASIVCLVTFLISNLNLHVFWTRGRIFCESGLIKSNCGDLEPYFTFEKTVRPWIVLALASIAPFVVILASNLAIVYRITHSRGVRESRGFKQTTVMCLSISFAFLILVTPSIILLIGKPYWAHDNIVYDVSRAVASQFVYINHSINFMLYALTGSRFREELVAKCSIRKPKQPELSLTTRMLSVNSSAPATPLPVGNGPPRFATQTSRYSDVNGAVLTPHCGVRL